MHVIATAGHVDHGKSTLVKALTGTDPDRFAEEKARGLTIDLGFAALTLPSGAEVAFVDVPGHVRFIRNMLAGVGAVDACLFVVAATEGWKPQSEEHLRILELLGLRHGVVALTKAAVADEELREIARFDVHDHLAGTFLEDAEIVEVDALSGVGLDELVAALERLVASTPRAADIGRPRLWVDRAFAAKGAGTVVTGTLTGGTIHVDDELVLHPAGRQVRVRALQAHGLNRSELGPGHRCAINLTGVDHHEVERGHVVVAPGQWHLTRMVDASLRVLDHLEHPISRKGAYALYVGSGEHPVRVRLLGGATELPPGGEGAIRLHLPTALPLVRGDRFVLRESGRAETVGGGEVLDVAPLRPASKAMPDRSTARVVAEHGWIDATELERLTGERLPPDLGPWVVDPAALDATAEMIRAQVRSAGALGLDLARLDDRDRYVLATLGDLEVQGDRVVVRGVSDPLADHPFVAALVAGGVNPPPPDGVDRAELRALVRRGDVVEADGIYFARAAIDDAARVLARLLRDDPGGFTVAQARDALGCTRKFALPLLNHLDATGVTRRRDDVRIGGPRLPLPDVR